MPFIKAGYSGVLLQSHAINHEISCTRRLQKRKSKSLCEGSGSLAEITSPSRVLRIVMSDEDHTARESSGKPLQPFLAGADLGM